MPASPTPVLSALRVPVVGAPMAGGVSTPELVAAVGRGGGIGFLAAGYVTAERLADDIAAARALGDAPFGVNLFVPSGAPAPSGEVERYARRLASWSRVAGLELGEPRFDDDAFGPKLAVLERSAVAVVSFTFGLPPAGAVARVRATGAEVWITVTSPEEAHGAARAGADAIVVQGVEAGGHRGVFADDERQSELSVIAALQLIAAEVSLPLVAAGGIMTGAALAAVIAGGAAAGQIGSALLDAAEAGTSPAHRAAARGDGVTVLTRAFSGRSARGIRNAWTDFAGAEVPPAYPEVHHLTAPVRAHGRTEGDRDLINLWAGQAHALVQRSSATRIVAELGDDGRAAIGDALARWPARRRG